MRIIAVATFILLAAPASSFAADPINKWCNDDRTVYADKDLSYKGYRQCGDVSTVTLCDPDGNRFFGNIKESGALKDCALGKRITVISHSNIQARNIHREDFLAPPTASSKAIDSVNPLKKVREFKSAADTYFENYDSYLKSLDKMIDGAEPSKEAYENLTKSQKQLEAISESFPDL